MNLLVPKDLMNRIATYLAQRPYAEVAILFQDIGAQVRLADETVEDHHE